MNHKRGRRKNARAGCLHCKPNKMNGAPWRLAGKVGGFSRVRSEDGSRRDLSEAVES